MNTVTRSARPFSWSCCVPCQSMSNSTSRPAFSAASTRDLEKRLKTRAQDSPDIVAKRMAKAADEMSHYAEYDYTIINRDIATSLMELKSILTAERLKRERQLGLVDFVKALREGR